MCHFPIIFIESMLGSEIISEGQFYTHDSRGIEDPKIKPCIDLLNTSQMLLPTEKLVFLTEEALYSLLVELASGVKHVYINSYVGD